MELNPILRVKTFIFPVSHGYRATPHENRIDSAIDAWATEMGKRVENFQIKDVEMRVCGDGFSQNPYYHIVYIVKYTATLGGKSANEK